MATPSLQARRVVMKLGRAGALENGLNDHVRLTT